MSDSSIGGRGNAYFDGGSAARGPTRALVVRVPVQVTALDSVETGDPITLLAIETINIPVEIIQVEEVLVAAEAAEAVARMAIITQRATLHRLLRRLAHNLLRRQIPGLLIVASRTS